MNIPVIIYQYNKWLYSTWLLTIDGMKKTITGDDYKVFIKRLRTARIEAHLTQVQAAKKLGATQAYVSKVEKGQLRVDVTQLKSFAKIYGKNTNYFLK